MLTIHELWPVTHGSLRSASLELDLGDAYHRDAHAIAADLLANVAGTHSVRLVGSAAVREPDAAPPRDLDMVVLVQDLPRMASAHAAVEAVVQGWQSRMPLLVDVVVVPLPLLLDNPFLHLPTLFQSVLLCGEPLAPRSLPADWKTALVLWGARHHEAKAMVARLGDRGASAEFVQRVRKRVLRLVAPVALAQEQIYTTDLRRCTELWARLQPASAALARAVLDDLERQDPSVDAVARLQALWARVFELDSLVRSKAGVPERAPSPITRRSRPVSRQNTIAELLAPLGVEEFFETYFEKRHVHVARPPGRRLEPLLDIAGFERILWEQSEHLADFVKIRRDDANLPIPPKQPFQWVRQQFNHGASIILNNLQSYDARFAQIHRRLEDDLQMPVAANVYLSPASARTFPPHFDSHDTFIVHLHGTKTWRIHDEAVAYPMSHHEGIVDPSRLGPPIAEFDLHPGDVLYIPRGTVHWATSNTEPSLHVTFGWYPVRQIDLLTNLLQLAADAIPELRQAVHRAELASDDGPSLARALGLLAAFAQGEGVSNAALGKCIDKRVARSQVVPDGGLLGIAHPGELGIDDWVERDAGLTCHVGVANERARVIFSGYPHPSDDNRPAEFSGPSFLKDVLEHIVTSTGPFAIATLPVAMTPGSKLVLVQQLVAAGLLRRVPAPSLQLASGSA